MTTTEIDLLIHCHTRQEPHLKMGSGPFQAARSFLLQAGLIQPYFKDGEHIKGIYITTEGGKMMVSELCKVATPIQKWTV